ncbi:hypothetical protein SAMN05216202_3384 [Pseudomonas mucidolens]|uniref:Uncharacterized protein n=1 Tax=Pseudomonas mucidolens TaxID=46679 RepID=A0A1H2NBH3_9PSED|nr:hypothetical protein SAMN05216202_3384 [Pseudomonas mucidolens]SQH32266.1 Uncharacterised protein [Pseudomonas mucidolens]
MDQRFAVGEGLQVDVLAQARAQDAFTGSRRQIVLVAAAGVIAVGMSDDGTFHRAPGVDVEIPGGAIQAFRPGNNKVHGRARAVGLLVMRRCRVWKFDKTMQLAVGAYPLPWSRIGPPNSSSYLTFRYLPGTSVNRVFPYTLSKFCGCIGKLRYCALSQGSIPSV